MKFNAWQLARAWASVAIAQGDDDSKAALYRTTLLEMYPEGIRLVSTDGYVLLRSWVPTDDWDQPEPGIDVLPDDVAICKDPDLRVLNLMRYALKLTKQDGLDTPVKIKLAFGKMSTGAQGTLDGLTQLSCTFQLDQIYDERIETPQYDGHFPDWRPLWFNHVRQPTSIVAFGADGILRLGELSKLWDKSRIDFDLGGTNGVAKVRIQAKDVTVAGLVMPLRTDRDDEPDEVFEVLPPSPEGIMHDYGEALDNFLAEVLGAENPGGDDAIDAALQAQMDRATRIVFDAGFGSVQILVDGLDVSFERADELIAALIVAGVLEPADDGDKYQVLITELPEPPAGGDEPDLG